MLMSSQALEYMATHCQRRPIGCALSTNFFNKLSIWDQEAVDAITGISTGNTWAYYRDQLYDTNPCLVTPCDDDTFYSMLNFNELYFYISGFEGLIIDPDLPDGKFYAVIEPVSRPECEIVSIEIIHSNCGAYGVATNDAYITFSNTNNDFGSYLTVNQYPTLNCDGQPVGYKRYEDTAAGKHFDLGIGFKWLKDGVWHRECVNIFEGITTARAYTTYENSGRSLVKFHLEDAWSTIKNATVPTTYSTTTTLSNHVANMMNYYNIPFLIRVGNYNPSFKITSDGLTLEEYMQRLCEVGLARFYWDITTHKFIFETMEWAEINRAEPVMEIDTCDYIIDLNDPAIEEGYSAVRVEQFSRSGGIQSFKGDLTTGVQVITNEYIQNQNMADYIANKMYSILKFGAQNREIQIIGQPYLEIGDVITVKERIDRDSRDGSCENIYNSSNWRICKIVNQLDENGYTQKLTLDKIGLRVFGSTYYSGVAAPTFTLYGWTNDPSNTVVVTVDGNSYNAVIALDGSFYVNITNPVADGTYTVTTVTTDVSGAQITTTSTVIVDTIPPATPYVNALLTNNNTPTITGTLYPDAEYAIVNIDGNDYEVFDYNFSFVLPFTADGTYTMTITAYDNVGNTSSSTNPLTIDTTPPPPPVINNIPNQPSATFTVTGTGVNGNYIYLIIDGILQTAPALIGTVSGSVWSITVPGLPTGSHTFSALQQDPAGNNSLPAANKIGIVT